MAGTLQKAFGYQGDNMNLPVGDLESSLPFYQNILGFRVVSRSNTPHSSAVLARDEVRNKTRGKRRRSFTRRLRLPRQRS
jgi:catechol 2,3-dioxygenase-like lactoylglutathione lyase family enzyme